MSSDYTCPGCGVTGKRLPYQQFCTNCRQLLPPTKQGAAVLPPGIPPVPRTSSSYTCPQCGYTATVAPDQRFCSSCGHLFPPIRHNSAALPPALLSAQWAIPYESGHRLAQGAAVLLAAEILLSWIVFNFDYQERQIITSTYSGDVATSYYKLLDLVALLQFMFYILTGVVFLMWFHRVYRNLPALGASGLNYSPRWAVGGFFVPFLSLVRPFQVMREIWQASRATSDPRSSTGWQAVPTPPLLGFWWGSWLLYSVPGQLNIRLSITLPNWLIAISLVVDMVAAVLLICIIYLIDRNQTAKQQQIVTLAETARAVASVHQPQSTPEA